MASVAAQLRARGHEVALAVERLRAGNLVERLGAMGFTLRDDLELSSKSGPRRRPLPDVRRLSAASRRYDVPARELPRTTTRPPLPALAAPRGAPPRADGARVARGSAAATAGSTAAADGVVAVCEAHARALVDRLRVPEERVLATRGAVDADAFRGRARPRAELGIPAARPSRESSRA